MNGRENLSHYSHHINGDHFDNRLENLQILCPNCHSQTKNFNIRKIKDSQTLVQKRKLITHTKICLYCGKEFITDRPNSNRKFCSRECYKQYLIEHNTNLTNTVNYSKFTKEQLIELCNKYKNISEFSRMEHIDRGTIRTYLHKYELYEWFINKNK